MYKETVSKAKENVLFGLTTFANKVIDLVVSLMNYFNSFKMWFKSLRIGGFRIYKIASVILTIAGIIFIPIIGLHIYLHFNPRMAAETLRCPLWGKWIMGLFVTIIGLGVGLALILFSVAFLISIVLCLFDVIKGSYNCIKGLYSWLRK